MTEFLDGRQKVDFIVARKTICIDFSGVLDNYQGWKGPDFVYGPRDGVADFLSKLQFAGYKVVILTAMEPAIVKNWLYRYELNAYVDDITNVKVPALVYLDDRGITFTGDFDKAFNDIINFKTHWETVENREGGKVG